MVHSQTKNDHLERISLLSAGLAPGVEHVSALVESKQHRWDFVALFVTPAPGKVKWKKNLRPCR